MNFFNSAYKGIPPWDIGSPQREIIRLAKDAIRSSEPNSVIKFYINHFNLNGEYVSI